jgi:HEPN domain-containing protein
MPAPTATTSGRPSRRSRIPTRYPNGFERGAPVDFYTRGEADRAIANAEAILEFCRHQISR